ncbi:MBL fold metallo-hydrolase [Bacillus sp. 2205SS5-2]|uniref:MBL fold metallo-hydrolase n=1 Tax=Bacillus sp. 2205SS5-2 TaxID=3109031 RepID=UPI003005A733
MQTIQNIGERFWYMTPVSETDRPILGMVIGDEKTLMIDAGNSTAHAQAFLDMLAKKQVKEPQIIALTHWHWDHIFGLSFFTEPVSMASFETKKGMEKMVSYSWSDEAIDQRVEEGTEIEFCAKAIKQEFVAHRDITINLPTVTFQNRLEIDLGGLTCVLQEVGGDHAHDSVVVYIKEEKILFLGDCIYPDIFSSKTNYTVEKTLKLLSILESFDAESYILSHSGVLTKVEFQEEVLRLKTLASLTDSFQGERSKITEMYEKELNRKVNEEEAEAIGYFVNGYKNN